MREQDEHKSTGKAVGEIHSRDYAAEVFWSDEDTGFVARVPDLPGCRAFGDTMNEVLIELRGAVEAWIGAAQAAGNPIPEPSCRESGIPEPLPILDLGKPFRSH